MSGEWFDVYSTTTILWLLFIGLLFYQNFYLPQKTKFNQYRLFEVRDRLYYLAAAGIVSENSEIYKVFSVALRNQIIHAKNINLISFFKAIITANDEILQKKHLLQAEISHLSERNEEVREFLSLYSKNLTAVVLSNSFTLKIAVSSVAIAVKGMLVHYDGLRVVAQFVRIAFNEFVKIMDNIIDQYLRYLRLTLFIDKPYQKERLAFSAYGKISNIKFSLDIPKHDTLFDAVKR